MKFSRRGSALLAVAALLAGCASSPAPVANYSFGGSSPPAAAESSPPPAASSAGAQTFGLGGHANGSVSNGQYTVAPGDTLYSIAFAHGLDFRALAAQNAIPQPYLIHPGQVLQLQAAPSAQPAGATASAAPPPTQPVFGPVTQQSVTAGGVVPASPGSIVAAPVATPAAPAESVMPPPAAATQPEVAAATTPPPDATRNVAGIAWRWPASGKVIGGFQAGSGGDGAGIDIAGDLDEPVRAAAAGTVVYSGNGLIGYGELVIIKHDDTYLSAYGHNSKRLVKEGERVAAGQEIALMGASGAPRVELHFEIRKNGKPVDPMGYLPSR
ncbi:MAG TPA: peptidoglycan DD-metalloendopeptidase family protein [Rhodanobacteraceae bacterium]|nr:peptidoglycan DD-metalloendopeptidase family protein [Rhodanobacteraceae bacterium]